MVPAHPGSLGHSPGDREMVVVLSSTEECLKLDICGSSMILYINHACVTSILYSTFLPSPPFLFLPSFSVEGRGEYGHAASLLHDI